MGWGFLFRGVKEHFEKFRVVTCDLFTQWLLQWFFGGLKACGLVVISIAVHARLRCGSDATTHHLLMLSCRNRRVPYVLGVKIALLNARLERGLNLFIVGVGPIDIPTPGVVLYFTCLPFVHSESLVFMEH